LNPAAPPSDWLDTAYKAYVAALEGHLQKPAAVRRISPSENLAAVLAHFLEWGYLPWWVENFDLEAAVREQLPALAGGIIGMLASPVARRRWVRQFNEEMQGALWKEVAGKLFQTLPPKQKMEDILFVTPKQWQAFFPELPRQHARYIYWETVWEAMQRPADFEANWASLLLHRALAALPGNTVMGRLPQIIHQNPHLPEKVNPQLVRAVESRLPLTVQQWRALLPGLSGQEAENIFWESIWEVSPHSSNFQQEWLALLIGRALAVPGGEEAVVELQQSIRQSPGISERIKAQLLEAVENPAASLPKKGKFQPPQPANRLAWEPEGIFVPLAGIVLIHPFLAAFFERIGLLKDEQLWDESARERAVHLLYFLATGLQQPDEQEVVLLKLLCGLEPEMPIEKELTLTPEEITEAEQLLKAVIENWEALQGSGPDGLRGSFLVREGKLETGEMGWKLTVEQKPYDVLLARLPWGLSPVMHSWMTGMVWVDWG
ncbi:MAG: hypothetical protein KDD10_25120, partial [Phaeodactylibacter sp.]|nr:hypothetical protein [Phaeodactylibacter sp.]